MGEAICYSRGYLHTMPLHTDVSRIYLFWIDIVVEYGYLVYKTGFKILKKIFFGPLFLWLIFSLTFFIDFKK